MMKKNVKLSLLLFLCFTDGFCCLNGATSKFKDGSVIYRDHDRKYPDGHEIRFYEMKELLVKFDSIYKKTADVDYLSDIGLIYIYQGKLKDAIEVYKQIESIKPNQYSTSSNLGTAYELNGENKKALEWIEKSVSIHPKAHANSEWIHVNILKYKVLPNAELTSHVLINTDFGTEPQPNSSLSENQLDQLSKAIDYQLRERMTFIKQKNKIIARLLFDLGNIYLLKESFSMAKKVYTLAYNYGFSGAVFDKRVVVIKKALGIE